MAKGRVVGRVEGAIVVAAIALSITFAIVTHHNPIAYVNDWLARASVLTDPQPTWSVRIGDAPTGAAVADHVVIVARARAVDARDLRTGDLVWSHDADWTAVAGDPAHGGLVAVVGRAHGRGFDVYDPDTGNPLWHDGEAISAWTYSAVVLTLTCTDASSCSLTARQPRSGATRWQARLPGGRGRVPAGGNGALSGPRPPGSALLAAQPVPPLLGFPGDDSVRVVSTSDGRMIREYRQSRATRVFVAGTRVVAVTSALRTGGCQVTIEARDPATDRQVWRREGYDPGTADRLGCEQRGDPVGGSSLLLAAAPDGRDVLLDAGTGAVRYTLRHGEKLLATDGRIVLLRSAGRDAVRGVDLSHAGTGWQRRADREAVATLAGDAALISDPVARRLLEVDAGTGAVRVDVTSTATPLATSRDGLVVNRGRTVGWLPTGSMAAG